MTRKCQIEFDHWVGLLIFIFLHLQNENEEAVVVQGEKEAEKMIVEAYSALLLAFLSTERFVLTTFFLYSCNI